MTLIIFGGLVNGDSIYRNVCGQSMVEIVSTHLTAGVSFVAIQVVRSPSYLVPPPLLLLVVRLLLRLLRPFTSSTPVGPNEQ